MYKTPHRDDQNEDQLPRRRRQSISSQRPSLDYEDDNVTSPKIRRASLYLDKATLPPIPDTPGYEPKKRPTTQKRRSGAQRRPYPYVYEPETEETYIPRKKAYQSKTQTAYTPPPPTATHHKHIRPRHSLYLRLQNLTHRRPATILIALLVLAIILVPVLILVNHTQPQATSIRNVLPNATLAPSGVQSALDPHELVIAPEDLDHPPPPVFATSAYLLDADTGATLYAHNPFMHLPMMSTTKLMTAVLAVEHGNLDQKITINDQIEHDVNQLSADSSLFGFKKGETYTLREMMYGMLLVSGNDAAIAVADTIGGNLPNFVDMMNKRAQQIGLHDTHYMNPHGLQEDNHYSSAHDLAILGQFSMNMSVIRQISGTTIFHIPAGNGHPDRYLVNGNQFLFWYPGVDGGKPGWDGAANFVQVVSVTRNHHHLIGVTMHTKDWWTDMRDLMNWGFDTFQWVSPYDVDLQKPIPFDKDWGFFVRDKKENTIPTADQGRYYIYTGYSISGTIMTYFDRSGGLKKFGYPTGLQTASGATGVQQKFEHATITCDIVTNQCSSS